jgi:hypothetical protein
VTAAAWVTQELSEGVKQLKAQNDELTGHNNPKQKIRLHQKIKEENSALRTKARVSGSPSCHHRRLNVV